MPSFSDLLATLGLAPKTLPQAKETLDASKATLDTVAALFTAAGLNLEQMLAAGPDALKAHLESIDNTEELAEALQTVEQLETNLTSANEQIASATDQLSALGDITATIGLGPVAGLKASRENIAAAFSEHISKQATLALAKTGHPPAHVPSVTAPDASATDGPALLAEYEKMPRGEARTAFFAKHEAAIWAAARAREASA